MATEQIQEVINQTYHLKEIPQLAGVQVGRAIASNRPIVDDSFHVGIVMRFASTSDMQIYLEHPKHKAFVGEYVKDRVERIVVYDF